MASEQEILRRGQEEFFSFREEVHVPRGAGGEAGDIWKRFLDTDPRMYFYWKSCRLTGQWGNTMTYRAEYRNMDYPPEKIYDTKTLPLPEILHRIVSEYELRAVVVIRGGKFDWTYSSFLKQSQSFYPNFRGFKKHTIYKFPDCPYEFRDLTPRYRIGRVMLKTWEMETQAKVKEIAAMLSVPGIPDSAKAVLIHNYLCGTVTYYDKKDATSTERSYIQSAYGALIKRQCVCQGFAEAYKRLCGEAGVPCDQIRGQILSDMGWHAWNIVHLDGGKKPCHVDCTWDTDIGSGIRYKHLFIGDEALLPYRKWERHFFTPCIDGERERREAERWIREHRTELLDKGWDKRMLM